ncbi:MAG: hypothetical protein FJ255_01445 [Phycisphaerae bacterium]|nr:hypothetical protein [Phycisphaerae bacterium]
MSTVVPQALALLNAGRAAEARDLVQRALARAPHDLGLQNLMARASLQLGDHQRAAYFLERIVAARPGDAAALANLGNALAAGGAVERAEPLLRKALAGDAGSAGVRHSLWNLLMDARRVGEAAGVCRDGLALTPGDPLLTVDLATADAALARAEEGVAALRAIADRHPEMRQLHQALAFFLNYAPGVDPAEILAAHRRYADLVRRLTPGDGPPTADRDPERRLRVGVLSSDLRTHSVAYFARAIFEGLDRTSFEVVGYSLSTTPADPMTRALADAAHAWHDVGGLQNEALVARVRGDRIDILLELNGLTRGGRLAALMRRAAPVQVSMIGYAATTGWPTMDYRVVDALTDPPGAEAFASERLLRLDPCFLCYTPPDRPPEVEPVGRRSGVVFGSFNDIAKLNARVIEAWARLLARAEGSRLLLKSHALRDATIADDLTARFESAGVGRGRLQLLGWTADTNEHLSLYRGVDVALDTFPYCGTTTTCEALLMGVPVVSLVGDAERPVHAARVGLSLLSAVGALELAASSEGEYVEKAASLAADEGRRRGYRAGLRERLLASPLCDRRAYAARLGGALREAWRSTCAGGGGA